MQIVHNRSQLTTAGEELQVDDLDHDLSVRGVDYRVITPGI